MSRIGTLIMVAAVALVVGCGGDEEEVGTKGPGEACDKDADCANEICVVSGDGSKACADSASDDGGGW